MKKYLIILVLLLCSASYGQVAFVAQDTAITLLNNVDIDTVYFILSTGVLPKAITSDTTKASRTAEKPPEFVRASGSFDLWIDRTNVSGTPDSFRVAVFPLHPITGRLAKNDSSFIVASASTFANIALGGVRYSITLPAGKGVGIKVWQGDLAGSRVTRLRFVFLYTQ